MTPIPDEDTDLLKTIESELAGLIQEEGLNASRVQVIGSSIMRMYGTTKAAFAMNAIVRVLGEMEIDKYSIALINALAAGSNEQYDSLLAARRVNLMKKTGFDKSEDTLRRWERRGMTILARMLVEDAAALARMGRSGPESIRLVDIADDVTEKVELLRRLAEDQQRQLTEVRGAVVQLATMTSALSTLLAAVAPEIRDSSLAARLDLMSLSADRIVEKEGSDEDVKEAWKTMNALRKHIEHHFRVLQEPAK